MFIKTILFTSQVFVTMTEHNLDYNTTPFLLEKL